MRDTTKLLQRSLLVVFLNVVLFKIFRYIDRQPIYVTSRIYGGQTIKLGAMCHHTMLVGNGLYSPGHVVCDPVNFLQLFPQCTILRVVDADRRHMSDDDAFQADYEGRLGLSERSRCPQITINNVSSPTVICDHLTAHDLGLRVPLAKFDSGVLGAKLMLSPAIGVYICQVLVSLRASPQQITRYMLRMKMRSYRLFAAIKWRLRWERDAGGGDIRRAEWIYHLSFVHTHCILGEKRPDYDFEKLWAFE